MNRKFRLDCPKCLEKEAILVEAWHSPQTYEEPEDMGLDWGTDCGCDFTAKENELLDKLIEEYWFAYESLNDCYMRHDELKWAIKDCEIDDVTRNGLKTALFNELPNRTQEAEEVYESRKNAISEAFVEAY